MACCISLGNFQTVRSKYELRDKIALFLEPLRAAPGSQHIWGALADDADGAESGRRFALVFFRISQQLLWLGPFHPRVASHTRQT